MLTASFFVLTAPLLFGVHSDAHGARWQEARIQEAAPQDAPPQDAEVKGESLVGDPSAMLRFTADIARRMPAKPHIKTRSRLQAELVDTALLLGDIDVAGGIAAEITNWRKGLALASIAAHLAEHGTEEDARAALKVATECESTITGEFDQGWRRDRVRATIAKTHAILGDGAEAARIQSGLVDSEVGRVAEVAVRYTDEEKWREHMGALVALSSNTNLDQVLHALTGLTALYERFGTTTAARDEIEAAIRTAWNPAPAQPRIGVLEELIDIDMARGDQPHAKALVDEIDALIARQVWQGEAEIAFKARAARKRFLVGDVDGAREQMASLLGRYGEVREGIVSIFRGRALRPVAETFALMGDRASADEAYRQALIEAVENPNGRPRLDDLVQTVRSIVDSKHDPSKSLRRQIQSLGDGLTALWSASDR